MPHDALNLANALNFTGRHKEVISVLREQIPKARGALGAVAHVVLLLEGAYTCGLYNDDGSSREELIEAVAIAEKVVATSRRVLGTSHPHTIELQKNLKSARSKLIAFDASAKFAAALAAAAAQEKDQNAADAPP